jgi:pyridoxal 5'-phosphate synthase pdxT subunit
LALQGDFAKHIEMLRRLGVCAVAVKLPEEIEELDGLIIPGGESTTVGKLMSRFGVDKAIIRRSEAGMPIFGTCTGMILLAKEIEDCDQPRLGLMNITVRRNAFGRQIDSFECDLNILEIGKRPLRAVFIRAPIVTAVGKGAEVLGELVDGRVVLVREGNCLAAAFHPELTEDTRVHEYFLSMVRGT